MLDSTLLQAAAELGECLERKKLSIATAESCTGGGIGYAISAIPGSSNWFKGGIISYSNPIKQNQLGVSATTLERFGAVSAETAAAMAIGARERLASDIAVAVTGVAGPGGGSKDKPVGLVWFGVASAAGVETWSRHFPGNRHEVRQAAIMTALRLQRQLELD